jgi:diadenosine tetraphosphatase ApaH/serine/threonine PP2A family protein phosphatase
MRVAVFADVHANLHALEAVLAAIESERPDAVWSLGDVVGYGPQPSRSCALVAAHADLGLVGNHDLGVLGDVDLDDFAPDAAVAARWTGDVLTEDARGYLASLSPLAETPSAALYHGSPRDPIWEYVLSDEAASASIDLSSSPLCLVGHSHVALAIGRSEDELGGGLAPDGTEIRLADAERWLLNPGSVGQPRDGDPRAAWLLLDLTARVASFRRVRYDVERTQREILGFGLPAALAARIETGT